MTALQMATIPELIEELRSRSHLFLLYMEFFDENGPRYAYKFSGNGMHMHGILNCRILPDIWMGATSPPTKSAEPVDEEDSGEET